MFNPIDERLPVVPDRGADLDVGQFALASQVVERLRAKFQCFGRLAFSQKKFSDKQWLPLVCWVS